MKLGTRSKFFLAMTLVMLVGLSLAIAAGKRSGVYEGYKAPPFQARLINGKIVNFPADYKGKIVLLDFWASWCGPCLKEVPGLVATHEKYRTNGFEILGVSLDRPQDQAKLVKVIQENKMTWPQIYDGQYMKGAVAVRYGVRSIPCPVLVDGDTGVILAEGTNAIGSRLPRALKKALEAKAKK